MSKNLKGATEGDVIQLTKNRKDMIVGKLYIVFHISETYVSVRDDVGDENCVHNNEFDLIPREAVTITALPRLTDIEGNTVRVGDYIACAHNSALNFSLGIFQIETINGPMALGKSVKDGAVVSLGCFDTRALKLQNYKAT